MVSKAAIGGVVVLIIVVSVAAVLLLNKPATNLPTCASRTLFQGTSYCYESESLQSFQVGASVTFRGVTFTHAQDETHPSYINVTLNLGDGVSGWADAPVTDGSGGGVSNPSDGHGAHFLVFPSNGTIWFMTNP